jgi:hypothetical protein
MQRSWSAFAASLDHLLAPLRKEARLMNEGSRVLETCLAEPRKGLGPLPEAERAEIVAELRGHVLESAGGGEDPSGAAVAAVLDRLATSTRGVTGQVQAALDGLTLGLLYLGTRRNLLVPIVSHGVSNSLAFVLIYFGRYPGL